jgi:hypothetical protein
MCTPGSYHTDLAIGYLSYEIAILVGIHATVKLICTFPSLSDGKNSPCSRIPIPYLGSLTYL